jgi:heterotetrameric sarcosine oxidase gamma subunit
MTRPIALNGGSATRGIAAAPFTPPPSRSDTEAALALVPATRRFSVRTSDELASTLRAATHDGFTALWLGPDEYLVFSNEPPRINADSIVDVSDRTVAFRVTGPRAAWCLNAFCARDLDTMPENGCTRTLFGKAEIVLWRLAETQFHIETARSYASYVWALLEEARREFLPPTAPC